MKSTIKKQEDGTIELSISLPWSEVKKTWEEEIGKAVVHAEIPGFRKGKAPKKIVEKSLNTEKIKDEVLKKILPGAYMQALTEHALKPVISPKIRIENATEEKDWLITAFTCETPVIDLGNYKEEIKKITAKGKIIIPGKEKQEVKLEEIVQKLIENVKITIPHIILENETERLLSQLLDEIKTLGLSLEQYLASTHKSVEEIRNEYAKKAASDITFEFSLQKIADVEKITIEAKEVEKAINQAKDDAERQNLEKNRYLLTTILRQQKTLDFLKNL